MNIIADIRWPRAVLDWGYVHGAKVKIHVCVLVWKHKPTYTFFFLYCWKYFRTLDTFLKQTTYFVYNDNIIAIKVTYQVNMASLIGRFKVYLKPKLKAHGQCVRFFFPQPLGSTSVCNFFVMGIPYYSTTNEHALSFLHVSMPISNFSLRWGRTKWALGTMGSRAVLKTIAIMTSQTQNFLIFCLLILDSKSFQIII